MSNDDKPSLPTPRSDAVWNNMGSHTYRLYDEARQLERDLAEARAQLNAGMLLSAQSSTRTLNQPHPAPNASEPAVPNGQYQELQLGGQAPKRTLEPDGFRSEFNKCMYRGYCQNLSPVSAIKSSWIPVSERLPADTDRVLVAWRTQDGGVAMDVETGAACKILACTVDENPDDACVTHWQELPSGPSTP